jgi:long-chain fatty acid transport protein
MAKDSRLKYGLGVYVPYGLGTTWDAYTLPGTPFLYVDGFPTDEMSSSISVIDVHPSVAYQILPNLSAGMGVSVMFGAIAIDKISFNPALTPGTGGYLYTPISTELAGAGIGIGANMGLMFKPTECLSIGLSGKLPTEIAMEGEAEVFLWTPAPADTIPPAKLGGKSDIDATLKLPAEIGIGLAYKIKPNWTVSLDYSYTMWERLDKVVVTMDTPIPVLGVSESELIFDWENTSRISVGTEYDMGCNILRAGFFMDESPIPDETQLPTISDINTKYSFNLGWGRSFGSVTVDANFQYIMFPEREIEASAATANNLAGTYNANSMSGNIGLSYKF